MGAVAPIAPAAPIAPVAAIAPPVAAIAAVAPASTPATTTVAAIAPAARAAAAAVARLDGASRFVQERNANDPEKQGNGKDQRSIHLSILSSSGERPNQLPTLCLVAVKIRRAGNRAGSKGLQLACHDADPNIEFIASPDRAEA